METKLKKLTKKYALLKKGWSPQQNLFYGFLTYVLVGFLLLLIPLFSKVHAPALDHLFIATSAVSTTGLVTISIFDTYNFFGQFIVMALFQLGGIGYLSFTTFMILSTTRKITVWHKKILSTEFTLPNTIKINDFLKSVILFTLIMETLGAILFFIAFKNEGMPTLEAVWSSIFHSISTFCTAGFSLFNDGFTGYVDNHFINIIISMLAISGSLGFIVITDFGMWIKHKAHKLSFTTKIIFYGFVLLLAFGTTFFYFFEPSITSLQGDSRFLSAFFQCMSAMTTVGFNTVDFGAFSQAMLIICIFLMYIGASPSGTAGGIKITTLTAILAIVKSRLQGSKNVTFLGKKIPMERLYIATSAFIFYTSLIVIGTFLITFTNDLKLDDIVFEVSSALGTVGISRGITSDLNTFGKWVIIFLMFIGRLGVLTFGLAIWARKSTNENNEILIEDIAV
ncbi:TrkH family potassium uptake protein [Polaribacter glomeratus]|uniref:Potassium transporter TrkH n=1 Tax=Polaribacter glomeratus TaxID=102 RepID=A0A2S7WXV0_9FLAO|nr:potassium transporter TrkG [Polaribacter glomeratus]PQJ82393.1 potassium transporter TrkH [Polaribacter glomeratus]TXD64506.1 potassium transporter TrkH [Polaribacter glomeratus]